MKTESFFGCAGAIISGRGFLSGAENGCMGFSAYPDPWRIIWLEKPF
jgi:hypothetical protein